MHFVLAVGSSHPAIMMIDPSPLVDFWSPIINGRHFGFRAHAVSLPLSCLYIMPGLGISFFKARMRLPSPHNCDLIVSDHSPAVIWAFHFDCEEFIPSNWASNYNQRGRLDELDVGASLLRALVLEGSFVADKQYVLSGKCSLVSNNHSATSSKCSLIADK
ncbi:hypothetical protein Acr_29g0009190 [Actinidia rufa]|uniref:Uncharacterized protein n=1 Tax=Actinidia rufa TaxID=165716 RepID=A0A7J0HF56_9ERIC|nr:hypothetical protein Acr_29g0009190 [Actinidia rufa]